MLPWQSGRDRRGRSRQAVEGFQNLLSFSFKLVEGEEVLESFGLSNLPLLNRGIKLLDSPDTVLGRQSVLLARVYPRRDSGAQHLGAW